MENNLYEFCLKNNKDKLLREWDYNKNKKTPYDYLPHSGKKVWWICDKGHSWEATIDKRTSGRSCPYCCNKKIIVGYNDLATTHPNIAKEWDYSKNLLTPQEVVSGTNKSVWWKCKKGHSWKAYINVRVSRGSGCPFCSSSTSIPEICIFLFLKKIFCNVEHRKKINNYEYDIFIKDINLVIEYDGEYYHMNRRVRDKEKELNAYKNNLYFLRIQEVKGLSELGTINLNKNVIYVSSSITKKYDLLCKLIIQYISNIFNITIPNINIDNIESEALLYKNKEMKKSSLQSQYPNIASEWHPIKNGDLKPINFSAKSNYKAWWVCDKGHEWKTSISHRTEGSGCPYCYSLNKHKGLITLFEWCNENNREDLLFEWDYNKNEKTPKDYTIGSNQKVYWKCKNNHFWVKEIRSRVKYKKGCPFCN